MRSSGSLEERWSRGKRFARAAGAAYLAVGVGLLVANLLFHHAAPLAPSASSTGDLGAQSVSDLVSM